MQKPSEKTSKMCFFKTEDEFFEMFVDRDDAFRKLKKLIDFQTLAAPLRKLYSDLGATGIDIEKGFKALLVQFWEDYSDREMEKAIKSNMAVRWFCGFGLREQAPDYSYFSKLRKRIGVDELAKLFQEVNDLLRKKGLFGDVFKFIDASSIITKTALWEERDQAIKQGEEKLNNANVSNYAADKEARWGAKSKNHIWFGYKKHLCADMRFGLIDKVIVTPANILDFQVIEEICPENAMIFMDKLYDTKKVNYVLEQKKCACGTIRKNNNKTKNRNLDGWHSKIRMPFEAVFSKQRKRAKFRGKLKITFQCLAEAICHNLKKALKVIPLNAGA